MVSQMDTLYSSVCISCLPRSVVIYPAQSIRLDFITLILDGGGGGSIFGIYILSPKRATRQKLQILNQFSQKLHESILFRRRNK
jgi:hypothetical protein